MSHHARSAARERGPCARRVPGPRQHAVCVCVCAMRAGRVGATASVADSNVMATAR